MIARGAGLNARACAGRDFEVSLYCGGAMIQDASSQTTCSNENRKVPYTAGPPPAFCCSVLTMDMPPRGCPERTSCRILRPQGNGKSIERRSTSFFFCSHHIIIYESRHQEDPSLRIGPHHFAKLCLSSQEACQEDAFLGGQRICWWKPNCRPGRSKEANVAHHEHHLVNWMDLRSYWTPERCKGVGSLIGSCPPDEAH